MANYLSLKIFIWIRQGLKKHFKGLSLVDTVVAIGVSIIILTVIASFTTSLFLNTQRNFLKDSATQLLDLISEQLRIVESSMHRAASDRAYGIRNAYPLNVNRGSNVNDDTWRRICGTVSGQNNFFAINTSFYDDRRAVGYNIDLRYVQPTSIESTRWGNMHFEDIHPSSLMGAFSVLRGSRVRYSIMSSSRDVNNIGTVISFNVLVMYSVLNIQSANQYVGPINIMMLKDAICPSSF